MEQWSQCQLWNRDSRPDSQFSCLQALCLQASPSPSVTHKPEMSIVSANSWGALNYAIDTKHAAFDSSRALDIIVVIPT